MVLDSARTPVESGDLDRADHWPRLIDHERQWFAAPSGSLGDLDESLQVTM
jgi:hypothetical protein